MVSPNFQLPEDQPRWYWRSESEFREYCEFLQTGRREPVKEEPVNWQKEGF